MVDVATVRMRVGAFGRPQIYDVGARHGAPTARDSVPALDLKNVFDFTKAGTLAVPGSPSDNPLDRALTLYKFAESRAAELLCDSNALRRFGPAEGASLAERVGAVRLRVCCDLRIHKWLSRVR